ncbi:MAG: hypothetical protein M3O09_05745 [Acidobacteriota bacterium]|nr:hypothetical protein [Acidobacteriota bacterium]
MSDRRRGTPVPPTPNPLTLPSEGKPPFDRRESDLEEAVLNQWTKLGDKVLAHRDDAEPEASAEVNEPKGLPLIQRRPAASKFLELEALRFESKR